MADRPILIVDFDGVLHSYVSGWQGADVVADPPVEGAIAWLYSVVGPFDVNIFSSRSNQPGGIVAMKTWLYTHEHYWRMQCEQAGKALPKTSLSLCLKWPTERPNGAFLELNDRALTFTGEWPNVEVMLAFKPWNKRETR